MGAGAALLAGMLAAACSSGAGGNDDGNGGPMEPPPTPLDVRGTYDAGHTFVVVGPGGGPVFDEPCVGTLTIDSQNGAAFSGEITIDAVEPCQGFGGVTGDVTGTVDGGEVEFEVSGIDDPLAAVGCEITGGEEAFSGTVTATAIDATRRITGRCTFGNTSFNASLDWNIDAVRAQT